MFVPIVISILVTLVITSTYFLVIYPKLKIEQDSKPVLKRNRQSEGLNEYIAKRLTQKESRKEKILEFASKNEKVRNKDIESLLGISDSTAKIYLRELASEGKLTRHGETGRGVFYTSLSN